VQNCGINPDFDLFLQSKNGGPSPRAVDRWCFRSTMDLRAERSRSSPEGGRTGVPVHGISPWQCGEQEEGMGILTPGGMSWWRGSDGWASSKGGGGRVSSTRRCSGHEGEERRAKMSVVKMAGGVAPFYWVREAMEGSGGGGRPARWVLIPIDFRRI
jgi:hypothetical protein